MGMSLLAKAGVVLSLIGAGSYFAYGYVTHDSNPNLPVIGAVVSKLKADSDKEAPSKVGESTPLSSLHKKSDGKAKLWAEQAAFLKAEEQKQAQHRAKCNATQSRSTTRSSSKSCRTRRTRRS